MSEFEETPFSADGPDAADAEFWAMARRVRRTADEELAEIEWETDRAETKRQDLTARAFRAMMEGERWQVTIGRRLIEGSVVHAGQNFVGLQDRAGNLHDVVHRHLGPIAVVSIDPRSGRAPVTLRPASFRARLLDLEGVREVELGPGWGDWTITGLILSVNAEHLDLQDRAGQQLIVPIEAVGYLSRAVALDRRGRPQRSRPPIDPIA